MGRKSIRLKAKDRAEMERFCKTGINSVKLVNRARIIPALDTSGGRTPDSQEFIAKCVGVSRRTVSYVRDGFLAAGNVKEFLRRKKRETPPVPPKK